MPPLSDRAQLTCPDCNKFFRESSHLDHHIEKQLSCGSCSKVFCTKSSYRNRKNHKCDIRKACPICGSIVMKLAYHMKQIHPENKISCVHCDRSFRIRSTLLEHIQISHQDVKFECTDCNKYFYIEADFVRHRELHKGPLLCLLCNRSFKIKYAYDAHLLSHSEGRTCNQCKQSFDEVGTLERHVKNQISCAKCDKVFCNKTAYYSNVHRSVCEAGCLICGESFTGPARNHLVKHRDVVAQSYTCDKCGKGYQSILALTYHVDSVHSKIKYDCKQCGKSFSSKGHYEYHVKGHKTTYTCGTCNRQFNYRPKYRNHIKFCDKPMPALVCDICGKELSSSHGLVLHKRGHTGEKPYKCSVCERSFARSGTYRDHVRTHTKEKPHKCSICGKGFSQATACKVHIRSHNRRVTTPVTHECCICGKVLPTLGQLRAHAKTHNAELLS